MLLRRLEFSRMALLTIVLNENVTVLCKRRGIVFRHASVARAHTRTLATMRALRNSIDLFATSRFAHAVTEQ